MVARRFISRPIAMLRFSRPDDGATICAIDCRDTNVALINSLERRQEAYHAKLKNLGSKNFEGAKSIHEQMRVKEEGLERWLHYDRWPRHAFRLLLFSPTKTYQDCATVSLEENAALAGGRFQVVDVSKTGATLASEESADWPAEKTFTFARTPNGFEIGCDVSVRRTAPGDASVVIGIEAVVNFLAPSAPDRYFESSGQRYPLRWASAVPASSSRVVDEWQKTQVEFKATAAARFLDFADRNCFRIRRRIRANLSRLADHRNLAGRVAVRRGVEGEFHTSCFKC